MSARTPRAGVPAQSIPARSIPPQSIPPQSIPPQSIPPQWGDIYAVVRAIPRGKVATYGQVAELAGIPSGHRVAARALGSCPERLPWQRVLGKKDARRGYVSIGDPDHASLQRALLESEGVAFDANGAVLLSQFGWQPRTKVTARRRSPAPSRKSSRKG